MVRFGVVFGENCNRNRKLRLFIIKNQKFWFLFGLGVRFCDYFSVVLVFNHKMRCSVLQLLLSLDLVSRW